MIRDLLAEYDDAMTARVQSALCEEPPFDGVERSPAEKLDYPVYKAEIEARDAIVNAFEDLQAKVSTQDPLSARDYLIHLTGRVAMDANDVARVWEIARGLKDKS